MGIDHTLIIDAGRPTTTKTCLYIDGEYILRRDDEETRPIGADLSARILEETLDRLSHMDAVILSDYAKGFFTADTTTQLISACNASKVPVVVDFKPRNGALFQGADLIAPNHLEAQALQPEFSPTEDLEGCVERLHHLLQCRGLVVTLGARGICGYTGTSFFHIPANSVEVVDVVGCGDTVRVGLALATALGMTLQQAAELANDTAAVVLQKLGTATLTREELGGYIRSRY